MAKGMTLKAILSLDAKQFSAAMKGIQGQIASLGNYMKSAFAIGSVAMFGKSVVMATKNFEDAMARAKAVSNATTDGFRMMEKEALRLGATTRYTATQVAETLEVLTRNGMSAEKATKSLASVLQLAQANAVGLADAGNMMTNTLNMFGLSVKDVQRVNDVLSSIASNTATNLQDLYDALVNAAPMAHALGISIEETAAALGSLAQRGIKGADAGTQLRMALQKMVDPAAMKKMEQLGIHIDEATIKAEGLQGVLKKLSEANLSVSQLNEIFTVRSSKAVLQLVNSWEDFNIILDITRNSAGTAFRMFEEGVGSVRKELDVLRSVWENFLISFGNGTSGPIKAIIRGLQNAILAFKTFGGTITNIMTLFTVGFSQKIAKMAQSFGVFSKANDIAILSSKRLVAQKEIEAAQIILKNKQSTASEIAAAQATVAANRTEIVAIDAKIAKLRALQVAYKMVLGVVIAVAAVIVEQLVAGIINANRALTDANKAIKTAAKDSQNLAAKVGMLKDMIGNGEDKDSLAAAVGEATRTFSEFAEEIKNAYKEAGKTGNYEKLKKLLQDIADLQTTTMAAQANQELVNATRDAFVRSIRTRDDKTSRNIRGTLKDQGFNKEGIDAFYNNIGEILIRNGKNMDKAVKELSNFFSKFSIKIDMSELKSWVKDITPAQVTNGMIDQLLGRQSNSTWTNAVNAYDRQQNLNKEEETQARNIRVKSAFDTYNMEIGEAAKNFSVKSKEYNEAMEQAASNLKHSIGEMYNDMDWNQRYKYDEIMQKWGREEKTPSGVGDSGKSGKGKTEWEKFTDTLDDYQKKQKELETQLKNGAISQNEFDNAILKLRQDTYLAIAAIDDLDSKMKNLSQPQKDTIKEVKETFPQEGEVGNALVELTKTLTKYSEKREEIKNTRERGGYDNLEDYYQAIDNLEDETWKTISGLKGLEKALAWLPKGTKDLYDQILKNVSTNKNLKANQSKVDIDAYTSAVPKFTGKNEKDINEQYDTYNAVKELLNDYLKDKLAIEARGETGALSTEETQIELDKLNDQVALTLLSFRRLGSVINTLPESYTKAAKELLDNSPKNTGEFLDKQEFISAMDNYSKEAAEYMKQKLDGAIDDTKYKEAMDKLVQETANTVLSLKNLERVINLVPAPVQDVYMGFRKLYNELDNTEIETPDVDAIDTTKLQKVADEMPGVVDDVIYELERLKDKLADVNDDNPNDNKPKKPELPVPEAKKEAAPVVNVNPTVSVDVNEKELGENIKPEVDVDVQIPKEGIGDPALEKALEEVKRAMDGEKKYTVEHDINVYELSLDATNKQIEQTQANLDAIKEAWKNGEFQGSFDEYREKVLQLEDILKELMNQATTTEQKIALAHGIAELQEHLDSLSTTALDNMSTLASSFDRVISGIEAIYDAFGESINLDGLKKAMAAINAMIQIMESLRTVIKMVQAAEEIAAKKKVINSAQEVAANTEVASSELTKAGAAASAAAAEGGESVASTPYVGPILAVAAIAAIVAALLGAFSSLQKFENGGILGGSSTHGDKNLYRGNSGELIINKAQQGSLYRAIASGNLGSGKVVFEIKGDALYGVLKNNDRLWGRKR